MGAAITNVDGADNAAVLGTPAIKAYPNDDDDDDDDDDEMINLCQ